MRKFLKISLIYVAIGLLYVLIGEYYLIRFKEVTPIEKVTDVQSTAKRELYYGRRILGNSLSNYKWQMFQKTQPGVLVLGQSVTLQFRDFMFEPFEEDFYNTGLMVRNLTDLQYVTDLFKEGQIERPKFILLGMDFSFVLRNSVLDGKEWIRNLPVDKATESRSHFKGMQKIFLNGGLRRIPKLNVGFGKAGMVGRGYRNDGSYRHKAEIELYLRDSVNYDAGLLERLQKREAPFIVPMEYDSAKAAQVLDILESWENMGIEFLLYFPPYAESFFEEARKDEVFYPFWQDYMSFQNHLGEKGYDLIPFCTPPQVGLQDDYMVDAEHPSEVMCGWQLYNYAKNSGTSNAMINKLSFGTLEELLNSEEGIPISFLRDSISLPLRDSVP